MGVLRDVYRGDNAFDFPRIWRKALVIAVLMSVGSVVLLFTRQLNLGIDFEGGAVWEVPVTDVSVEEARSAVEDLGVGETQVQFVTAEGSEILRVRAGSDAIDQSNRVAAELADLAGVEADEVSITAVGPSWGEQITEQAIRALVFFFIAIALYMSVRLEWRMAVGALTAVVHDLLVSVGVYALFGFPVTPATVIAFLTILGFSLYDTIVVFDKAQDVTSRVVGREPYRQIMNRSLNQTLMRSVNTTITTIAPVASLLVIGSVFLGATTLQEFALALFVGLTAGAYSSVMVAAPVVSFLKEREPRFAFTDGDAKVVEGAPASAAPPGGPEPRGPRRPAAPSPASSAPPTGAIPPRPRKTKKRR